MKPTAEQLIRESTKGGPGLDGYAYCADVYCPECAEKIMYVHAAEVAETLDDVEDFVDLGSDEWPCPIFFGESDTRQHCSDCEEFLYGPEEEDTE